MTRINLQSYRETAKKQFPSLLDTDVDRIIAHVTELPLLELFLNNESELTAVESATMDDFLKRRTKKEPLQYIFGEAAFRNFVFYVGEGVLIPRPETEMIVDLALELLPEKALLCDLGTGSGAIAISIAMEKTDSDITALDLSKQALKFARKNIEKYSVKNITLLQSNLFDSLKERKFHIITANLPYVAKNIYGNLECEVHDFEPETALLSGNDGLDLIRRTATEAQAFLYPDGAVIFEFSPEQKDAIIAILEENNYHYIKILNDLSNRARFAIGKTLLNNL